MPHVNETRRARTAAIAALAACLWLAGCTDPHRRPPLAGVPTGETVAGASVYRLPSIEVVGRRAQDVATQAPPAPARSPLAINAARRDG